jgi:hypothetical protein
MCGYVETLYSSYCRGSQHTFIFTSCLLLLLLLFLLTYGNMADGTVGRDVASFNGGPILLSTSPETSVELRKQIESLHQNKVLKVELETYKLLEIEYET